MTKEKIDDLEAVRSIADLLEPFENIDRERIIRWAKERLKMQTDVITTPAISQSTPSIPGSISSTHTVKSFFLEKNPKSDNQFAAVIAYFYKFEAPVADRKETINGKDLQDACRLAGRGRLNTPSKTLANAYDSGYFDRAERGQFRLSTVGENLVAMVLPNGEAASLPAKKTRRKMPSIRKAKK